MHSPPTPLEALRKAFPSAPYSTTLDDDEEPPSGRLRRFLWHVEQHRSTQEPWYLGQWTGNYEARTYPEASVEFSPLSWGLGISADYDPNMNWTRDRLKVVKFFTGTVSFGPLHASLTVERRAEGWKPW